jgi:hypothetical protein
MVEVPPALSQEDGNVSDPYIMSVSAVELATNFRFFIGGQNPHLLGGVDGRDLFSSFSSALARRCKQTRCRGVSPKSGLSQCNTILRIGQRSFDAAIKLLK